MQTANQTRQLRDAGRDHSGQTLGEYHVGNFKSAAMAGFFIDAFGPIYPTLGLRTPELGPNADGSWDVVAFCDGHVANSLWYYYAKRTADGFQLGYAYASTTRCETV